MTNGDGMTTPGTSTLQRSKKDMATKKPFHVAWTFQTGDGRQSQLKAVGTTGEVITVVTIAAVAMLLALAMLCATAVWTSRGVGVAAQEAVRPATVEQARTDGPKNERRAHPSVPKITKKSQRPKQSRSYPTGARCSK